MKQGKVYLVGAGPSDEGLFTIKGQRVLQTADAVVYDALVGNSIVSMIPDQAEKIYVGKHAGHHTVPQEEINQILVELAKQGKNVVRLKGGDPFLFGRGGEELEELLGSGIDFEVVPGVTSALSVPAYAGIPVTHREYASSLHIITGHKKQGEKLTIDFEALHRAGGTYLFLMGVTAMADICQGFLQVGMSPDMPAAMVARGTTAMQRKVVATLGTLVEEVRKAQLQTPAILIIGQVCSLAEQFAWYENMPLFGKRIVVTRPASRSKRLATELRNRGAEVLEIPTISTRLIENQDRLLAILRTWKAEKRDKSEKSESHEQYEQSGKYEKSEKWLVFTSPTGVDFFFQVLCRNKIDVRCLSDAKIAVIGEGSERQLEEKGFYADLMPEEYHGEALGKKLAEVLRPGDHVVIPRAKLGNQELIQEIRKVKDVVIEDIPLYDTLYETSSVVDLKALFEEKQDMIRNRDILVVFTSASTVRGFVSMTEGLDYSEVQAICIGEQTAETAAEYGMSCRIAKEATEDSLVELICGTKNESERKVGING